MARANNSFYALLGVLGFGPMSGYAIKEWVNEGVGYFCDIDYKQIYPTLKLFADQGLATFKTEKTGKNIERKVYMLTDKGLKELKDWLHKPIEDSKQSANEIKLKLFFGHHISLEKNLEHIQRFKDLNLKKLQALKEIKEYLNKSVNKNASLYYRMTTVMNGEIVLEANVRWCDEASEYLNSFVDKK